MVGRRVSAWGSPWSRPLSCARKRGQAAAGAALGGPTNPRSVLNFRGLVFAARRAIRLTSNAHGVDPVLTLGGAGPGVLELAGVPERAWLAPLAPVGRDSRNPGWIPDCRPYWHSVTVERQCPCRPATGGCESTAVRLDPRRHPRLACSQGRGMQGTQSSPCGARQRASGPGGDHRAVSSTDQADALGALKEQDRWLSGPT